MDWRSNLSDGDEIRMADLHEVYDFVRQRLPHAVDNLDDPDDEYISRLTQRYGPPLFEVKQFAIKNTTLIYHAHGTWDFWFGKIMFLNLNDAMVFKLTHVNDLL